VVAFSFAVSASASADAVVARLASVPAAGPVLAGGMAEWASSLLGGRLALRAASPGRPVRTLQIFTPPPNSQTVLAAQLSASSQLVGLRLEALPVTSQNTAGPVLIYAGAPGEALAPILQPCIQGATAVVPDGIDVSGQSVAYQACSDVSTTGLSETLSDLSTTPATTSMLLPNAVEHLRIAGPFFAYERSSAPAFTPYLVVGKVASRVDALSVPLAGLPGAGSLGDVELAPDGTVAFSYVSGDGMQVAWASPASPAVHTLNIGRGMFFGTRFLPSGLLLVDAQPASAHAAAARAAGGLADGKLETVALTGSLPHVVASGVNADAVNRHFDFDGTNVVFVTSSCDSASIRIQPLNGPAQRFSAPMHCALRFARSPRRTGRSITFTVSCAGASDDCTVATATATAIDPTTRRRITVASSVFDSRAPADVAMATTLHGLKLLRSHPRVRVTISAHVAGDAYTDVGSGGGTENEPRTATVTL
jgi:hypothetical protein